MHELIRIDNIFSLRSYLTAQTGRTQQEIDQGFEIPDTLDYID